MPRRWKPRSLSVTPVESLEQIRAAWYVITAGFNSLEAADALDLRSTRRPPEHPCYDGSLSRLGWWGQRPVGHVGVIRLTLRLGRARLPFAGIAAVCTDPRARGNGVASALMKDVLRASRQAGLPFSLLFGIPDFYHRFGFVPAWPGQSMKVAVARLPSEPRWRARKAGSRDLRSMVRLYEAIYGTLDGTALRDPRVLLRPKRYHTVVLAGRTARQRAYVAWRRRKTEQIDELEVFEAAGVGPRWKDAVLAYLARQATKINREQIVLQLPLSHPIGRQLAFTDAVATLRFRRNSSQLVAVLDFAGLTRAMAGEWQSRLREAGVSVPRAGLVARFRGEVFRWYPGRSRGGAVRLARRPRKVDAAFNDALARLVMGYGCCEDIVGHYRMKVAERAMPVLRAIFPERQIGYSRLDHF